MQGQRSRVQKLAFQWLKTDPTRIKYTEKKQKKNKMNLAQHNVSEFCGSCQWEVVSIDVSQG